ncbi:hypothetical protein [Propionivibrio sp.]|uniref:hypothetical protein n=1 Tax=Propionivibrio sp. TaxID=2212460 RepID=UPI003BF3E358
MTTRILKESPTPVENDTEHSQKLNSRQRALLNNGFPRINDTQEEIAKRGWYGKSLEEIAEAFAHQEGKRITPRMVRYHYQQLSKDKNNAALPLKRGRRAGSPNRHRVVIPAHDSLRALTQLVWSLTRFSITDIHRLYKTVADQQSWKLPTIQYFRHIVKALGIRGKAETPSRNLMERHSIRVLQHRIKPRQGSRNQWTVLAAIENITGFINLRIFKTTEGAQELSATKIADFIKNTIVRLALPIYKIEINAVTSEIMTELVSKLPDQQIQQCVIDTQAGYSIPNNLSTEEKFCEFLSKAVNGHNENCGKSKLIAARTEIFDEFQLVTERKRRGWSQARIKLRYPETPDDLLTTFCKKHLKTDVAVKKKVRLLSLRMLKPIMTFCKKNILKRT